MAKRKWHGRMRRYMAYRSEHFLPEEAKELFLLRRLDYYELKYMVRERRILWRTFQEEATKRAKSEKMWRNYVHTWYMREGFVEKGFAWWKKFPEKNIWFWFDSIRSRLPEEKQYPRNILRHKRMSETERGGKARQERERQQNEGWIDQLMRAVAREPSRDEKLTEQAQRMGFAGESLWRAAVRRGYAQQLG